MNQDITQQQFPLTDQSLIKDIYGGNSPQQLAVGIVIFILVFACAILLFSLGFEYVMGPAILVGFIFFLGSCIFVSYFLPQLQMNNFKYTINSDGIRVVQGVFRHLDKTIPWSAVQDIEIETLYVDVAHNNMAVVVVTAAPNTSVKQSLTTSYGIVENKLYIPGLNKDDAVGLRDELLEYLHKQSKTGNL